MNEILLTDVEVLGVQVDITVHYKEEFDPDAYRLDYYIASIHVMLPDEGMADISNLLTPEIRACIEQDVALAVSIRDAYDEVDHAGDLS